MVIKKYVKFLLTVIFEINYAYDKFVVVLVISALTFYQLTGYDKKNKFLFLPLEY